MAKSVNTNSNYRYRYTKKAAAKPASGWQRHTAFWRSRKPAVFVVAFAVLGVVTLFAARAATAEPTGMITGLAGKCIDIRNNERYNGNVIWMWPCSNNAAQKWTIKSNGTISNAGWCIDVRNGAKTQQTPIWLWKCDGNYAQIWRAQSNGTLVNPASGLCLDVRGGNTANGTQLWLWKCVGNSAQVWKLPKVSAPTPAPTPQPQVTQAYGEGNAHAALPGGARRTPVPNITLDYSAAPELENWLKYVRTLLQQWYPVLGDFYAQPGYVPTAAFAIRADPNFVGIAHADKNTIVFSSKWVKQNFGDASGMMIHESSHIVQYNASGKANLPSFLVEGTADYMRDYLYNDRAKRVMGPTENYMMGYATTGHLINYAEKLKPGTVNAVGTAGYKGTYSDAIFSQRTGKTIGQLWQGLTGRYSSSTGEMKNAAGSRCMDVPNYKTDNGTRIQMVGCNTGPAQKWAFGNIANTTTTGYVFGYGGKCLEAANGGRTAGTAVQYWDCADARAQKWQKMSTGALRESVSGLCLQTVGASTAEGAQLQLAACSGSAAQRWTVPQ